MDKPYFFLISLFSWFFFSVNLLVGSPLITSVNPFFGSSSGGQEVIIIGSGFTGASGVDFGLTPAASFTVDSDSMITAISPPHSPQVVSINIHSVSGISPNTPDSFFVYQGDGSAYVLNNFSNNISVINTRTDQVSTIGGESNPVAIAFTPDATKAFIVNENNSTVSIIDTATQTVIANPTVGGGPFGISITPDGKKAYVINEVSNNVSVIDTATNTVSATIMVGDSPNAIAITPDGSKAYVLNQIDNTVSVIDTATNSVIASIGIGLMPLGIAITPDGTKAYIVNDNSVSVISTSTNTIIATIGISNGEGIIISPNGTRAYVTNDSSVLVIDTSSQMIIATIPVGSQPVALAITPDGSKVYVANFLSHNVTIIDTATNTVITNLPIGFQPVSIAITPDGTQAFVVNLGDNNVSVIETSSNTVIGTPIPVGTEPETVSITPDQAPLAKFTSTLAAVGHPSTFDATTSLSPIGTIIQYFWDFGDGTTFRTSSPIVLHTYLSPGVFSVTLTVTNSSGTSTQQIFNIASNSFHSINTTFITNNGGPTASVTKMINIPPAPAIPLPPRDLRVHQVKNRFATQTDLINILNWKAPLDGTTPVAYQIYRNDLSELIAVIPANQTLQFFDHNRREGHIYTYFVQTKDEFGNVSVPSTVVIKDQGSFSKQ